MSLTATIDLSAFDKQMARYIDELGIEGGAVVRKSMGLLAREILDQLPPKSGLGASKKAIEKDVRKVFASPWVRGPGVIPDGSGGRLHWYQAGHHHLYGVEHKRWFNVYGVRDMARTMRDNRNLGKKLHLLGTRGKASQQKVYKVNRFVTDASQITALIRAKVARIGKMKAGMVPAIEKFVTTTSRSVPVWVARHVGQNRPGSAQDLTQNTDRPVAEMTNFAFGIGRQTSVIQNAVKTRAIKMMHDVDNYLVRGKKVAGFK